MPEIIKIRKGLDIKLTGEAERRVVRMPLAESYGISPLDFEGFTPKLLVKPGDRVKAGTAVFFDKNRPDIVITSPVSGTVETVERGEKRKLLSVVVAADPEQEQERFDIPSIASASREEVIGLLLRSGMWPFIVQRPYGIIADPAQMPKAVFVSGFDSAPLAPDMDFALADQAADLQKGIEVLRKLTTGKVHLGLRAGSDGVTTKLEGADRHWFKGPHPAGNVGVHINRIDPINKGELVWTVGIQDLAIIGRLFNTGKVDMRRTYALTGSEILEPCYVSAIAGAPYVQLLRGQVRHQQGGSRVRIISGNVLSGKKADARSYVALNASHVTVIPEGDKYEFLGWAMPRLDKFSVSHTYFSWLMPKRRYTLDTNMHGGHRPYIVTGLFERYVPMDIYPMYLLKACLAGDIDKMENLGIYEVVEEDLALCEFVDPSKNDVQKTIRDGINLMIKEL